MDETGSGRRKSASKTESKPWLNSFSIDAIMGRNGRRIPAAFSSSPTASGKRRAGSF